MLSPCLQLEDNWQDVTSLADTNSGVLMLHDVNKSSSGLYRCQTLDLDDMTQREGDVELMVNCKAGGQDTAHPVGGTPFLCSCCPAPHPSPRHRRGPGEDGAVLTPSRRGQREAELQCPQPCCPGLPMEGCKGEQCSGTAILGCPMVPIPAMECGRC